MSLNPNDLGKTTEIIFWWIIGLILVGMIILLLPAAWWTIQHEYTAITWQELKEAATYFIGAFIIAFVISMAMMGGMRR